MNQKITSYLGESPSLIASRLTESTLQTAHSGTETIFQAAHSPTFLIKKVCEMVYQVETTDEFEQWFLRLEQTTQIKIDAIVKLLEEKGANLPYPYSSSVENSRYSHMRELRVQHKGNPYRIIYAFDPRRIAILLLGGNKKGNDRWYEENIPKADKLYEELLEKL